MGYLLSRTQFRKYKNDIFEANTSVVELTIQVFEEKYASAQSTQDFFSSYQ